MCKLTLSMGTGKVMSWLRKCRSGSKGLFSLVTKSVLGVVITSIEPVIQWKQCSDSAYGSSLTFHLWSNETQIARVGSMSGRTKQITKCWNMHCDWFILPLLLPTLTIWFSLDHKRNISDGVRRNGNVLILLTLSSSVTLTPVFYFHQVISALTAVLMTPTLTLSLVKISLKISLSKISGL